MRAASTTKAEFPGVVIFAAQEIVPDNLGGDEAEGDAISDVTKREAGVRKPGMRADVGEAVLRLTKSAGPRVGDFQRHVGKQSPELFTSVPVLCEINSSRLFAFTKSSSSPPPMTRPSAVVRR